MTAGQLQTKPREFPELHEDAENYYLWAERVAPDEPYGVAFHLLELRRILNNLNELINKLER